MKRVFISAISLQRGGVKKVRYIPYDFTLKKNKETGFPIIPIIENYMTSPSDVQVILLRESPETQINNPKLKDNYEAIVSELHSLGLQDDSITPVYLDKKCGKKECAQMLLKLIDAISNDSIIYADITYQTKPVSATILYAMNLIERIKDAEVEGIYYGEITWLDNGIASNEGVLYNITAFKHMTDIAEQLSIMDVSDIRGMLGKLTGELYEN